MQVREENMLKTTKKAPFYGICTALVTPFSGGEIDYPALARLIERQIAAGVTALVAAGTTGEAPALAEREKTALFSFACERAAGRAAVIAGTGSPDIAKMLALSREAARIGCDGLLIVTPYYNKGTESGVREGYRRACETGLPILLYNVPSRTGTDLSYRSVRLLSREPEIVGIKEASGGIGRIARYLADGEVDLHVYTGCDNELLPTLALGGGGAVSVISNVFPGECVRLCRLFAEGRIAESREIALALEPLTRLLFSETNPAPVKSLLSSLGLCGGEMRLPFDEVSPPLAAALTAAYRETCLLLQKSGEKEERK